jgi:8-oxo-dGTP pyrophosphatase MutT (NUDIX family)
MYLPRILSHARFCLADIPVEVCDSAWKAPSDYEELVARAWQDKLRASNPAIWDGTYYRVLNTSEISMAAAPAGLRLGTIRYRYIATFSALHREHGDSGLDALHHLSTIALVRTSDGHFLFGKRARNGSVDLIGGGVQKDELPVSTGMDIERNLFKEVHEEIGIPAHAIDAMTGIGTLLAGTSNILLLGLVRVRVSKAEAKVLFSRRRDNEMADLVTVPEGQLAAFLHEMSDYRRLIPALL